EASGGAGCALATDTIRYSSGASLEIIELKRNILATQTGEGRQLRMESAARVRVRQSCVECAVELVRTHVIACFAQGRAERLDVRAACLVHPGRKVGVDVRVVGVFVRFLTAGHVRRVIVAARLRARGVDGASSGAQERALDVARRSCAVIEI